MNTAAEEAGLEVKVPTDLEVATAIPIPSGIGSVSSQPFSSIERAPECQLEAQVPTDLQVAAQPDTNKYYIGSGGSGHPTSLPLDQSDRFNQPQEVKKLGRLKVIWVLTIITVICLALAVGGELIAGLHKSNSPSHTSTASTRASNAPVTITQASNASISIDVHSAANSPPQKSNPPPSIASSTIAATTSAPPSPQRLPSTLAAPPAPPLPSTNPVPSTLLEVSNNDKGSSKCGSLSGMTCRSAYSQFNNTFLYKTQTSYILPSGVDSTSNGLFQSADSGCVALWTCDSEADYAVGMTGAQIKAAFDYLYQVDGIQICGSSYLSNGCYVTTNRCVDCVPSVPCGSLSAEDIANKYPCV